MDEKLSTAQDGRDPLREDAARSRTWPRSSSSTTAPRCCRTTRPTTRCSRRDPPHRGGSGPTSLHNALYVTLKDLSQAEEGGRAAAARDRAALGRRGHGLARDRRPGARARAQDRDQHLRDQPAAEPASDRDRLGVQPGRPPADRALPARPAARSTFPTSLSELDAVYDRIAEELRTQYNLGYVSSNPGKDGKWRRIVVRDARARGAADPPQARLLRAAELAFTPIGRLP